MYLHFERNANATCDCSVLSLSWMGKVPDDLPEDEGWKLNRNNYYQEGWLATGNVRGLVGVTFTTSAAAAAAARRAEAAGPSLRTNYNLRGHRSEVMLVKWNEPYQKLASCDKSGVIFVWIKYEGRWSIELINDRSTPVTHFSWSHDGRMALICYQDGFVLVGSVSGQRYWSSMLPLEARITSGCWTPDDLHVYLGTAAAQLVVMDVHGAVVSQVQLNSEGGITAMAWSCDKFKMEESEDEVGMGTGGTGGGHVLAVSFGSGELVFLHSYEDLSPVRTHTGLDGTTLAMEWANSRDLLAVAGTVASGGNSVPLSEPTAFTNMVKFYSEKGNLLYTVVIPYTMARVSALTWGHAGRRLFVACGGAVQTARVWRLVAPLQLLARVRAAQALPAAAAAARLPLPPRLRPLVASLFAHTIRCCVPEPASLRWFVSRPPGGSTRLHCTMLRHEEEEEAAGGGGGGGAGGGGAFTLYLEHLGGLVPLLKGRRTSKIRPEFVIFDPQAEELSPGGGGGEAPRYRCAGRSQPGTPRPGRRPPPAPDTDSSDTEREGCSGSPRLQRKKRTREKRRQKTVAEREKAEPTDDLVYIDSLPEDVRLVQVTSNIWGTKFKLHGLASGVPANLGQLTYKTSLLHLQPRQMTLLITELAHACEHEDEPPRAAPAPRAPALARPESCEELPRAEPAEALPPRVSAAPSVASRHAISPLRCDGSVPTLQSPKNAVAPTDIIFERPSPQAVACGGGGGGGRGDFCGARADYGGVSLKSGLGEQPPFSLNLSVEPRRHVTIRKSEPEGCLSKLRKNMCGKSEPHEPGAAPAPGRLAARGAGLACRGDELSFIDEEGAADGGGCVERERERERRPARTPPALTAVSPVCPPRPPHMPRSCSVGYLDLVDPAVLRGGVSVAALRRPQPRRLVLVTSEPRAAPPPAPRPARLSARGKSRSLEMLAKAVPARSDAPGGVWTPQPRRRSRRDSAVCQRCRRPAPLDRRAPVRAAAGYVCAACSAPPPPVPVPLAPPAATQNDYSKYYCSLEQLALRLRAARDARPSAPASPRPAAPAPRPARSVPTSPAARARKDKRTSSASPIRQLLNSPLLSRRRYKKFADSSDEDSGGDGAAAEAAGAAGAGAYRDLESFQKQQLRNKLRRAVGAGAGGAAGARQLVMHNKAPMWNENSQVYQLDFGGRVTQESAKNFQIEFRGKQVMQFGRIDGKAYTLDFQHPFSALQAFAVALANVTQRLK